MDLTRRVKKWDVSVGRLTEPMGASGYWFGQSYDGVRAVWNGHDSQVRIGVGTFNIVQVSLILPILTQYMKLSTDRQQRLS